MGRATDLAAIQFRMLNRSKGPAVWAPRAQCDRGLYRRAVRTLVEAHPGVRTIQGTVARLILADGPSVAGVETLEGRRFGAAAVVITTGTFLRGRIHIGTETRLSGGRAGESAATHLAEQLENAGLTVERFKTGTPPRIDGRSVDFSRLERQESEIESFDYSWSVFWPEPRRRGSETRHPPQLACWITFLEADGKAIIAENIGRSAMYGGAIASRGPRYCPSVEDKVVKFPNAERHQLFLEPEGHDTTELYVNGLSTSLPATVQLEILRSVRGLEAAAMTRAGYAIEYDYYPPTQLDATLQVKAMRGLFFAGQINGTTGYEEAAALGLWAGANAAAAVLGREPFLPDRSECYMAVLVDDLVTKGTLEPYRMFTSRAEYRLLLREDNADLRLTPAGHRLGLVSRERFEAVERRRAQTAAEIRRLESTRVGGTPLLQLLRRPEVTYADVRRLDPAALTDVAVARQVEVSAKYEGYIRRMLDDVARFKGLEQRLIPDGLDYRAVPGLSTEIRERLTEVRPRSLGQASRIPGVTPAAISILTVWCHRARPAEAAH
jgi:tRNA uridine 5-carboxymethylaminomethyl modification enzyme